MPGFLTTTATMIQCAHMGMAQATQPAPRVKVMGQPVVPLSPYQITGCANPPPTAGTGPCLTANWTTAALRIKVMGQPVLLQDSQATCVPTGTPLIVGMTQTRVKGF